MKKLVNTLAILAASVASQAIAQDRPLQWHINGGYSMPEGLTSDYVEDGWVLGTGVTWKPNAAGPLALRANLSYSYYEATNELLDIGNAQNAVRIDDGNGTVWGLDLVGILGKRGGERAGIYGTAGIGVYRREVEFTQTVLTGGIICDPWWGFCYEAIAPGEAIVADESTTKFGWSAGLGVEFPSGYGSAFFVEARYMRIETSEPTEFIPIQIGYRW